MLIWLVVKSQQNITAQARKTKFLHRFDKVKKSTNAYKRLRVSFILKTVCLLDVSATPVASLREVYYSGHITKTFLTSA